MLFIFILQKNGHKIDSILKNNKASFCVVSKDDVIENKLTSYFESVIIFGKASIIDDNEEIYDVMLKFGEKLSPNLGINSINDEINKEFKMLSLIKLDIEHISRKQAIELVNQTKKQQIYIV